MGCVERVSPILELADAPLPSQPQRTGNLSHLCSCPQRSGWSTLGHLERKDMVRPGAVALGLRSPLSGGDGTCFPSLLWERGTWCGALLWPPGTSHPSRLTGDIEPDGSLCDHPISFAFHLTGEVGAVVSGPWGDGEHGGGVEALGLQRVQSGPHPGEAEALPSAVPWQAAGQAHGAPGLQALRYVDVRLLCQD